MKKSKKLIGLIVAAVMAFGIVVLPATSFAQNAPTVGKKNIGVFRITSPKAKTIRMVGTTDALKKTANNKGKKAKTITIVSKYKLDEDFIPSARKDSYTVTRIAKNAFKSTVATRVNLPSTVKKIDAYAFNGSKAKTLTIKIASKSLKKTTVRGMLKGAKATKVTILVPRAKLAAYKKFMTKANLGGKAKITVKGF